MERFLYTVLKCVNLRTKLLRGGPQCRQFTPFEKISAELKISIFSRLLFRSFLNSTDISNYKCSFMNKVSEC